MGEGGGGVKSSHRSSAEQRKVPRVASGSLPVYGSRTTAMADQSRESIAAAAVEVTTAAVATEKSIMNVHSCSNRIDPYRSPTSPTLNTRRWTATQTSAVRQQWTDPWLKVICTQYNIKTDYEIIRSSDHRQGAKGT